MSLNTLIQSDNNSLLTLDSHQNDASKGFQDLFSEIKEFYKINSKISSAQNDRILEFPSISCLMGQYYENLLINIFQVNKNLSSFLGCFFIYYSHLIQHMDSYNCNSKTKYLAKIYIDFYLRSNQEKSFKTLNILSITAMNLAIKFNESFIYPLELILRNFKMKQTVQELINFEIKLLKVLKFKLNYVTPFTYLDILRTYLPQNQGFQIYNNIEVTFQLCALDLRLIGFQCVHIFLGCLAAFVEEDSEQHLKQLESRILRFSPIIPFICQIVKQQLIQSSLIDEQNKDQKK